MSSILTATANAFFFTGQVLSIALLGYGAWLCAIAKLTQPPGESAQPAAHHHKLASV
jgi:hypothetical protein